MNEKKNRFKYMKKKVKKKNKNRMKHKKCKILVRNRGLISAEVLDTVCRNGCSSW